MTSVAIFITTIIMKPCKPLLLLNWNINVLKWRRGSVFPGCNSTIKCLDSCFTLLPATQLVITLDPQVPAFTITSEQLVKLIYPGHTRIVLGRRPHAHSASLCMFRVPFRCPSAEQTVQVEITNKRMNWTSGCVNLLCCWPSVSRACLSALC